MRGSSEEWDSLVSARTDTVLCPTAALQRSAPQGCPCLPHHPAALLSSAWTRLSTATLLASSRLWPS